MKRFLLVSPAVVLGLALAGCSKAPDQAAAPPPTPEQATPPETDKVAAVRAKLSPEDRALVEAQEWCASETDSRLGEMGVPVKLTIKGQPVFVCCKGCQKDAEKDPDQTLATVEKLKKKKAEQSAKGGS